MSDRETAGVVDMAAEAGEQVANAQGAEELVATLAGKAVAWDAGRPVTMLALMDWALEESLKMVKASPRDTDGPVGFNVALQLNDGAVWVGRFVDWAVKSEDGRALCVAKLGDWVRKYEPKYMAVFCDMKTGRASDVGGKMAVIGASRDAAWARIYDISRAKGVEQIAPERDGPADGIWVDVFQRAMRESKQLAS
jgi:hypothetical protein